MSSKLTIVMYHYIRDLKNSRYPKIKGLDISLFENQIKYIRKYYHTITMEEVVYSIDNNKSIPSKSILLTFDDAYVDHYNNVFPILDKYKIQGSFYAPIKAIAENTVLDVNKIHFILAAVDNKNNIVKDLKKLIHKYKSEYQLKDFEYYYGKLAKNSRYDTKDVIFIKRLLQVELIEELRIKIVKHLFKKYIGINEGSFSRELYMNKEQLSCMLRNGMHIGNHGYNHYWWNSLNEQEMGNELDLSMNFLEGIGVDMNNWTACYPYGSYDNQAIRMLKERGCKLALTTEVDIATTDSNTRFTMPRLDANDLPISKNHSPNKWFNKLS